MTSSLRLFLPRDAAALSVGAERVARALVAEARSRGLEISLTRTGTRGMLWLEPMLEVERDGVRHGFGPLEPADVPALFDAGFEGHPKALGPVEQLDWRRRQQRLRRDGHGHAPGRRGYHRPAGGRQAWGAVRQAKSAVPSVVRVAASMDGSMRDGSVAPLALA